MDNYLLDNGLELDGPGGFAMDQAPLKATPANMEAEKAVLGSLLIDPDAIIKIANFLRAEDFFRERHTWIYEAILLLHERREPADFVTLVDELERSGRLEEIGGPAYVTELINSTPTAIYVDYYARIVERTAILRRLINAAGRIAELAYDESKDVNEVVDRAEQLIFGVSESRIHRDLAPISAVMGDVVDRIDFLSRNQGTLMGVPTGFALLDKTLGGLQKSDLIILAGRPGMGKSSLALSMAQNAAQRYASRVAIFSLEMSSEQLVQRLLSMEAGIDSHRLRMGEVFEEEWPILMEAANKLAHTSIFIDDTPAATVMDIRTKARRLYAEHGLDMILIDYMQLMSGSTGAGRNENRQQEISYISRSLKGLARELSVPVVALSQLSRAVESRSDKRPMLSDLRESGCLAGETPIYLPEQGRYAPIRELEGQVGFPVLALNSATWQLQTAQVSQAFKTGVKPVFRLETGLGRTIRATANHKFLTLSGWKRLDELEPGMRIAQPRTLPGPNGQEMADAELGLLKGDVYWDQIVSIEPDGETDVYDLTVPDLHNFVAGNIIVHNSIEQDADVVMFIYREDYYVEDTDRKNIADVIIAKHRHGSTGSVGLYFRKELTQFRDLELKREELDY